MFKNKYKKNYLYFEEVKTPFVVILIYIIIALILVFLFVFPGPVKDWLNTPYTRFIATLIVIVDLIFFWSYSQLIIKINDTYLKLSFGIFRKKILLKDVIDVEVKDFDKKNYSGYGFALGKDKSVGFITGTPHGILIKMKPKNVFVSTENPDELKEILESKI